jgi:hypothetical protein
MSKNIVVVSAPVDTYSGYGARARDFVKALLQTDKYDIKILSQRWGNTRAGYLKDHNDLDLTPLIINNLTYQPDVWVQITVPNEFQKIGKYNIGVTAGIETTIADPSWIDGCNRMDLVLTSSEHSKNVFQQSVFQKTDNGVTVGKLELSTTVEVLFEGIDINTYTNNASSQFSLEGIEESFCFLFVGHWLQGNIGEDRKNVGYMIKSFMETFKNKPTPPALILKTSLGTSSIIGREEILDRIDNIKNTVKGKVPNIYLIDGDISDEDMNNLYNHPKIKAMISLTKGEGFGRPLLEFSVTGKPILASGWSGHLDFLSNELAILVGGTLTQIHPSAVQKNVLIPEAQWFTPSDEEVGKKLRMIVKDYKKLIAPAKKLGFKNKTEFSFDKMVKKLESILTERVPDIPKQVQLTLPKLELPKLKKITD